MTTLKDVKKDARDAAVSRSAIDSNAFPQNESNPSFNPGMKYLSLKLGRNSSPVPPKRAAVTKLYCQEQKFSILSGNRNLQERGQVEGASYRI
mmetsp:Transcript_7243/g.32120  ORF Transcript_7243/g.32120 Transcript_7243/m.32120 type:complete len:93 (-) Transcript_7243:440-718(-)